MYFMFSYMLRNEIVLVNFDPLKNASSNAAAATTTNLNKNKSPMASPDLLLFMKTNTTFLSCFLLE